MMRKSSGDGGTPLSAVLLFVVVVVVSSASLCLGRLQPAGDDFSDHSVFLRAASTLLSHEPKDTDEQSSLSRVRKTVKKNKNCSNQPENFNNIVLCSKVKRGAAYPGGHGDFSGVAKQSTFVS